MESYYDAVTDEFRGSWWNTLLVIIFTIGRIIFGWAWFTAGLEKLSWLSTSNFMAGKLINGMVNNLAGPQVTRYDPLGINWLFAWIANNIFIPLGELTDYLVVFLELAVGICLILGLWVFWSALVAVFLNLQYMAAGSFNNFGYIWVDLALMKFSRYADFIGISGYMRYRRSREERNELLPYGRRYSRRAPS